MKKIIALALLVPLVLTSCGKAPVAEEKVDIPTKSVKIQTIQSDYFTEDIKVVGKIAAGKETTVSSQTSGVIKSIQGAVGKRVKAGESLAAIDFSTTALSTSLSTASTAYSNALTSYGLTKESAQKDLENAQIALENARTNKENTYTSTEKQLQIAQAQLDNILTQQTNTKKTTGISVDLARKSRDNAKLNLDNFAKTSAATTKSLADKKTGLYTTIRTTINSSLVSIDSALTQADLLLGVTEKNRNANDGFEMYLGAKDTNSKVAAENAFRDAKQAYDTFVSAKDLSTNDSTDRALANAQTLVANTLALYDRLVTVLDNSIVSTAFPQSQLDGLKATIAGKQTGLLSATQPTLVLLKNSIDDLNNTISSTETSIATGRSSYETALDIAETNLANAEAGTTSSLDTLSGNETLTRSSLENTIASVKSARDSVDNALRMAEAQYDSTRAKLQTQITGTKTQTDAAKGQKDLANIQFDNGIIKAPFDGIILSKQIELGSLVSPGAPTFTIGDDSSLIVRMDVNSDVVSTLSLGQTVQIAKGDKSYTGSISLLSPGSDATTRQFRVEAKFSDMKGIKDIFNIGDFADVHFQKKRSDAKSITVPFSALISGTQGDFIIYTVAEGNIARARTVKIGAQNGSSVEILSGLAEGDRVVTEGALILQEGDKVVEAK